MLVFIAILSVVLVVIYAMNKGKAPEHNPFQGPPPMGSTSASMNPNQAEVAPSGPTGSDEAQRSSTIDGHVELSPALAAEAPRSAVLFVVVRPSGQGTQGPPVAVVKIERPNFPVAFTVTQADVMIQGVPFVGPFDLYARLDGDGDAMTRAPGDILSSVPAPGVKVGQGDARIVLDQRL